MTLKEQLTEKKQALVDLKPQLEVEEPTDEAVQQGETLAKEIAELETKIEKAAKSAQILKTLGTTETTITEDTEDKKMSQIEEFTKKAAELTRETVKTGARVHLEKANTDVVLAPEVAEIDRSIAPVGRRVSAASLFTEVQVSGNAITYYTEDPVEEPVGGIGTTAQNNKKSQISTGFTKHTEGLDKVAAFTKETDEILSDAAWLTSEVQNTLSHRVGVAEDDYVVDAIGTTSGLSDVTYDGTTKTFADAILEASLKIKSDAAYDASAVLLNPADVFSLLTAKDGNKQYYGGGYFTGAYGTNNPGIPSAIWGIQIYASSKIPQGSALVAARQAVKTYRKGGMDLAIAAENADDFEYNRVTLRAEVRLFTAVIDLKGVVLVATDAS